MFERSSDLEVVFIPWDDVDPNDAVRLGAEWLHSQQGERLVLLHQKNMYNNNPLFPKLLTRGVRVDTPRGIRGSTVSAVLAPWPSDQVLGALSSLGSRQHTSVCVVKWGSAPNVDAWLAAHRAIDLLSGHIEHHSRLSPVALVAMEKLRETVNHNNGLVQGYEKSYAIRTLQELHRSAHWPDPNDLCAFALANGFTPREVDRLREYAEKVAAGHRFRLPETVGPRKGESSRWEKQALLNHH